jgi:hypothetical protein
MRRPRSFLWARGRPPRRLVVAGRYAPGVSLKLTMEEIISSSIPSIPSTQRRDLWDV